MVEYFEWILETLVEFVNYDMSVGFKILALAIRNGVQTSSSQPADAACKKWLGAKLVVLVWACPT